MRDLKKVAIIIGAGEYGAAAALALAERDVCVALIAENFDGTGGKLGDAVAGGQVAAYTCSFLDIPGIQRTIDEIAARFGRIDILVNAALERGPDGFWDVEEEAFQRCVRVNMKLPFFAYQACAAHMRTNGGGRVINLSSAFSSGNGRRAPDCLRHGQGWRQLFDKAVGCGSVPRKHSGKQPLDRLQRVGRDPPGGAGDGFCGVLALDASPVRECRADPCGRRRLHVASGQLALI